MFCTIRLLPLWSALLALLPTPRLAAESLPIFLDGLYGDWQGTVEHVDPAGDGGSSGVDFREVDLANDDDWLFLRFQTTIEVGLQENGNNLWLFLDTDMNASTGLFVSGIGAELEWRFGERNGTFHGAGGAVSIGQNDIRLRHLPSVTASEFEVAIARDVEPDGFTPLFSTREIRLVLRDMGPGGDQVPNNGPDLAYTFDLQSVSPPNPIALRRHQQDDVRIVTWNARDLDGFLSFVTPSAERVFSALDPDVICFQELYDTTAPEAEAEIESFLPSGPGESWYAEKQNDNVVVSRFPIVNGWPLDGNLAVLLDADSDLGADLLLVCAHLPCCTNDFGRQEEADHIMQFFSDAIAPGGSVDVPEGTAFMITGDLNLVGDSQQLNTLLTGDIVDEGTYGPDFAPDWDGTALADLISSQTEMRFAYTWRNDFSSFAPGRLDFVLYNDSVLEPANHFILYTPEMSASQLTLYGMQSDDVPTVSDHLPLVADFRPVVATGIEEEFDDRSEAEANDRAVPDEVRILSGAGLSRGELRFTLELDVDARVAVEIFDARGIRLATLRDPGAVALMSGQHPFVLDGRSTRGVRAASGVYLVRVVAYPVQPGHAVQGTARKLILLR